MIIDLDDNHPLIAGSAWLAPTATVIGRVSVAAGAGIWYGAVLRGDEDEIVIGENSNIQDNCVLHTDLGHPAVLGRAVTVGHGAIVHGARVDDEVLIGMGAVLMNGAHIGSGSIVGAGTVVSEGTEIPPHSLVLGVPGRVRRETTERERQAIAESADGYVQRARRHAAARRSDRQAHPEP